MLGAVLMNDRGEVLHFGGQVMKNVAGYDVSRVLAGSLGTLGLLLEVSLKVLPRPFEETTLRFDMEQVAALRASEPVGRPAPADLGQRLAGRRAGRAPVGRGSGAQRRADARWAGRK